MQLGQMNHGLQFQYRADGKVPTQTPIYCAFVVEGFYMLNVPPWGNILTVEMAQESSVGYFLEINSLGLPAGTMLGMRWTPQDGIGVHRSTHQMTGEEPSNVRLRLEDNWIIESENKRVLIEQEAVLPDGTVQIGEAISIRVPKRLKWGAMTVGDNQQDFDDLDPSLYPDGIRVHYQPIVNIEEWHPVRLSWSVAAIADGGFITLYKSVQTLPGKPDGDYSYLIPPEGYTGFENHEYDRIVVEVAPYVVMAPEPNRQHIWGFEGYGIRLWLKRPSS
ncbi:hypothetical protein [Pseudomonas putida]|uniref:Uncharacterized protein n=1 Tax=Pseudomonas putida TaxID=303 RepID=A0A1Q9RBS1_PSEPU|nr:hypothetical protein [Pseudomonas putida]OLS64859.1 hypothetical protein PSEMO_02830 [Pseudomonas putida]